VLVAQGVENVVHSQNLDEENMHAVGQRLAVNVEFEAIAM
jgi:hypothetical protein